MTPVGMINYSQFLDDIKTQPFKWWHDRLMTFVFDNEADVAATDLGSPLQDQPMKRDDYQCELFKFARFLPKGGEYRQFCRTIATSRLQQ